MFLFFGGQQEHRDPSISSYSMHILSISWSSILSADHRLAAATSWLQSIFSVLALFTALSLFWGHEEYRGPSIHWSLDTSMRASRRRSFGWHLCVRSTEVGQWIMILEWLKFSELVFAALAPVFIEIHSVSVISLKITARDKIDRRSHPHGSF